MSLSSLQSPASDPSSSVTSSPRVGTQSGFTLYDASTTFATGPRLAKSGYRRGGGWWCGGHLYGGQLGGGSLVGAAWWGAAWSWGGDNLRGDTLVGDSLLGGTLLGGSLVGAARWGQQGGGQPRGGHPGGGGVVVVVVQHNLHKKDFVKTSVCLEVQCVWARQRIYCIDYQRDGTTRNFTNSQRT